MQFLRWPKLASLLPYLSHRDASPHPPLGFEAHNVAEASSVTAEAATRQATRCQSGNLGMFVFERWLPCFKEPRNHSERPHLGVLIPEPSEVLVVTPNPYPGKPDLLMIPASSVKDYQFTMSDNDLDHVVMWWMPPIFTVRFPFFSRLLFWKREE